MPTIPAIEPPEFTDLSGGRGAAPPRLVVRQAMDGAVLTKSQKRFNQLVEKLKVQRGELRRWQTYQRLYEDQIRDKYRPMVARLRSQRIAMAQLLDKALDGRELGKRERDKATYLLNQLIAGLLADGEETDVVSLHDKYAASSFAELRHERMQELRAAANEALQIDVAAYAGDESPAAFEAWIADQVRASRAAGADSEAATGAKSDKKTGKRQAARAQVADGGTRALRETYRKLVSELHPDRETDTAEQARKTGLMQSVNQAYKAGDLLALLELQLSIEQIDAAALASLADEKLRHYIHVLEEQSRQVRAELEELIEPFATVLGEESARKVTPDAVQRRLDGDLRDVKTTLRKIEMDVICFADVRQLRQSLGSYHVEPLDDEDLDMPEDFDPGRSTRRSAYGGRTRRR